MSCFDANFCLVPLHGKNGSGKFMKVSLKDYGWMNLQKWSVDRKGYPRTTITRGWEFAHRLVLDAPKGKLVDHINGDILDNRRSNLRFCTTKENSYNSKAKGGASSYKGVGLSRDRKKFVAYIRVDGKRFHIGTFSSAVEAAQAYDVAARKYFGEFAKPNFE